MEAASLSRRIRLEELKRRKHAALHPSTYTNGQSLPTSKDLSEEEFEEKDEVVGSASEEAALRKRIASWSTAKLVHSFRALDRKQRVDYAKLKDTIERDIEGMQELVLADFEQRRTEELDLHNIQPKRINWDLKRDMQKRLARLERRDREARLILIRQRIAAASAATKGGAASGTNEGAITQALADAVATADLLDNDVAHDDGASAAESDGDET